MDKKKKPPAFSVSEKHFCCDCSSVVTHLADRGKQTTLLSPSISSMVIFYDIQ